MNNTFEAYSVIEKNGKHLILESETGQTVQRGARREMDRMCKKLNNGAGFTGFTPSFFVGSSRKMATA
jgi:hypothetical protein